MNSVNNQLERIIQILQSKEQLSQADKDLIQTYLDQVRDHLPRAVILALSAINPVSSSHQVQQSARQVRGLQLSFSILENKLITLEARRDQLLQELDQITEIDTTTTQLGHHPGLLRQSKQVIANENNQVRLRALKLIQDFLKSM